MFVLHVFHIFCVFVMFHVPFYVVLMLVHVFEMSAYQRYSINYFSKAFDHIYMHSFMFYSFRLYLHQPFHYLFMVSLFFIIFASIVSLFAFFSCLMSFLCLLYLINCFSHTFFVFAIFFRLSSISKDFNFYVAVH